MKAIMRLLLRILFRFRAYDMEALKTPGPVLLVPNHLSWIDWLFLWVCLDDDWRFVVSSVSAQTSWVHRAIMINRHTLPVDTNSPYAVKRMAEFLKGGGRLVLFAEGRLSRTGTLMKLFDGTGFLIFKTRAKVITAYLRGAERLPLSPNPGWKKFFTTVTAHFSPALTPPQLADDISTSRARGLLTTWLRDRMVRQQFDVEMAFGPRNVLAAVAATARQVPKKIALEDATFKPLTYRKLMVGTDVLSHGLGSAVSGGERVGVLLPNVNATPVVILALWKLGKIPAMLNFSSGTATMLACVKLAGLKHIVTSRVFLEKARLNPEPFLQAGVQLIYLENVRASIGGGRKLFTLLRHTFGLPSPSPATPPCSTAVIVFTSGSEGVPKGVELTHENILANIRQMLAITDFNDRDRLFNCLPLFHSFGLTVGTLIPLVRGLYVFLYPSPLHYRTVPSVLYDRDCTIFISTNTFLNGYARKGHPYDFRSLKYLFAAAEKVQEATAQMWSKKYGIRILEGYGATECAPCVTLNTTMESRAGSAGRLVPGMEYKLERAEGVAEGGRLFVRGPNVMKGYLNADANAKFAALDGWYDTGDIVSVDEDGFVHIRGRMKRFAKVSGEMVSLTAVEDALAGAFPRYGLHCQTAVITRPDENKGEVLIVVTNEPKLTLDEIRDAIKAKGLTNLSVPREIKFVKEIPKLGTGKVNHRELQMAMQKQNGE
jgi:acyl-[acyl-carrier-protein]-phospholipid O-acyltransferase/long-chain-fatty-acid--[acyl-carrier-protein] ligase